jgi:hypothetical protein
VWTAAQVVAQTLVVCQLLPLVVRAALLVVEAEQVGAVAVVTA